MKFYNKDVAKIVGIKSERPYQGRKIVIYDLDDETTYLAVVDDDYLDKDIDNVFSLKRELLHTISDRQHNVDSVDTLYKCENIFEIMMSAYRLNEYYRYQYYCAEDDETKQIYNALLSYMKHINSVVETIAEHIERPARYERLTSLYSDSTLQDYMYNHAVSWLMAGKIDITSEGMVAAIYGDEVFYNCYSVASNTRKR